MAGLQIAEIAAGYGRHAVLRGVSAEVAPGSLLALLGPSGCGKSTLLNVVNGSLAPTAGRVNLAGRDITDLPPEARNIGTVFQDYALFPHLSARGNVAFGLEVRGLPRAEVRRRADATLDRVGLSAAERDRKPHALSGGQRQRVALARALAIEPDLLLLDEPFANLDRPLRDQLRGELRRLQRATGVTTVLVTHDPEEALAVADTVAVMLGGTLRQVGTPEEVYHRPRTPRLARLLGDANLFDGPALGRAAGTVCLVRPERCRLAAGGWPGAVVAASFHGADSRVEVACDNGLSLLVRERGTPPAVGTRVALVVPDDAVWAIPESDGPGDG